ncbi:hypothetical protein [Nocardioides sp. B-3]|uniref:hypothetical protein n=1 Tax=Nocardioides sp. B-3 TaxID=2895565 RepID=UPI002152BF40|nr:hypothetical protein [Nocardioides sp. B-3]UUZ57715.1 hypothetical protein LP418_14870 [Nocardioides sp. B-3]
MNARERAKYLAYRIPVLRRTMSPTYPYKINPAQLAAMVGLIEATRGTGAAVAEVGVARGRHVGLPARAPARRRGRAPAAPVRHVLRVHPPTRSRSR